MKLVPIFCGVRRYWLLALIGVGVSIATINIIGVMLLKSLWQAGSFTDLVFWFVATALLVFVFSITESYCAEKLGQNYVKAIRCQLYQGLIGAPSYLAPKRVGVVMSRLITDSNQIKNWASIGIPKLTIHSISTLGLTIFLCLNWGQLGWLAVGLSVMYLIALAALTPKMYKLALEIRRDRGRLSGFLGETIIASRTINQFNRLNRETRRLARHSNKLAISSVSQTIFNAASRDLSTLVAQVMTILVLVLFLWEKTLPNQELAVVMLTLGLLFNSLKQLNTCWNYAITFYAAKVRLEFALSNAAPTKQEKETRLTPQCAHSIQLKSLQLTKDSKPISLSINAGSATQVASGEEAEVLVDILTKHQLPISGRITISGRRLEWLSQRSLNKNIVTVTRSSHLLRGTVSANLKTSNANNDLLRDLFAHFDLHQEITNESITELGNNLSSGKYAKLLLIKSLLHQPGLLILSHPDICADSALMQKVLTWQTHMGFTLMIVGRITKEISSEIQTVDIAKINTNKHKEIQHNKISV